MGFIANLSLSTSIYVEIRGAILGLSLAWDLGLHHMILQLEPKTLVQLIKTHQCTLCYLPMFQKFWQILDHE